MKLSTSRRTVLACLVASLLPIRRARAVDDPAAARIRTFYDSLLANMRRVTQPGVSARYDQLSPVIRDTFDFPVMTRMAIGPSW